MEEAKALGVALDSSFIQRLRLSKNVIFGSQFINDLTELAPVSQQESGIMRQQSSKILDMLHTIQSQAPAYQSTSVMNQFLRQHTQGTPYVLTQQSAREASNLENLIAQLTQYDNKNDTTMHTHYVADISYS